MVNMDSEHVGVLNDRFLGNMFCFGDDFCVLKKVTLPSGPRLMILKSRFFHVFTVHGYPDAPSSRRSMYTVLLSEGCTIVNSAR